MDYHKDFNNLMSEVTSRILAFYYTWAVDLIYEGYTVLEQESDEYYSSRITRYLDDIRKRNSTREDMVLFLIQKTYKGFEAEWFDTLMDDIFPMFIKEIDTHLSAYATILCAKDTKNIHGFVRCAN